MSGVIGVFLNKACGSGGDSAAALAPDEAARLAYFGLHGVQHRGQEGAGIAVGDGRTIIEVKDLGLVTQVFKESALTALTGHIALGHAVYAVARRAGGLPDWDSVQPHMFSIGEQLIALGFSGTLINSEEIQAYCVDAGLQLDSDEDAEAIAALVGKFTEETSHIREGIARTMNLVSGSYAAGIITESAMYAFRDPLGICPLCLGELHDADGQVRGWVIASETCGLDIVGAHYLRDIEPGEVVKISELGVETLIAKPAPKPALCVFEYVYFARPDSEMAGMSMYESRVRLGEALAAEAAIEADLVMGVPDSGIPGAVGYAKASGIAYGEGLTKNRYVGRTFIQPTQALRQRGIRLKLNPMKHAVRGKRLIVVDDSIVRGNTSKQLIAMLREAGAKEVHMRITSPPVIAPCHYGIDMSTSDQLIGAQLCVEDICRDIGADSLAFLSLEAMAGATSFDASELCMACFNGDYPIDVGDKKVRCYLAMRNRI
ncbi:MAG: amidophosphoribosyltransferase [Coriobacteriia bacterium]|nr:amidophosphoribosyltransferase [Coriobacteriia bacterium]